MITPSNPAVYLSGPFAAEIKPSPYPSLQDPSSAILKIAYVGVCGSDVHFYHHGGIAQKVSSSHPLIMGHEATGIVHSIGSAVPTLNVGDHVAIEPGTPCRRCNFCKEGKYNLCPTIQFAGAPPTSHGLLRKYISHPSDFLYPLPSHISLSEGVLLEPLAVAVHACRLADIKLGHDVLVFGAGTVGLLCAAVAKAMGAQKVVSLDINASRLSFAQSYTSTSTYLPPRASTADSISSAVKSLHFPAGGADIILEATGQEICIDTGIQVCKPGGTFVQVGLGKEKVVFPIVGLGEKEITMRGSFRYGAVDFEMAMGLVREGRIGLTGLVTGVVPFEETTEAWERTAKGEGIKTVIKVGDF